MRTATCAAKTGTANMRTTCVAKTYAAKTRAANMRITCAANNYFSSVQ